MSSDRILKGKSRLMQYESEVYQKKKFSRKVGILLPEDSVQIPKIGQWSLDGSNQTGPTLKPSCISSNTENKKIEDKQKPQPISRKSIRQSNIKSKITKVSIPKAAPYIFTQNERLINFPQGTITTDLDDILRSKYRRPTTSIPPLKREIKEETDEISTETQFFPLENFDDSTYEEFSIEELMKDPNAYSQFSYNGQTTWEECTVLEYNEKTQLFTIEWKQNKKQKKVPRFNIRFVREDLDKFNEKIAVAKQNLKRYQDCLRFNAQVQLKSINHLPSLSDKDFIEIHSKVNIDLDEKYYQLLADLDNEVKTNFKILENQFDFEYQLKQNPLIPYRDDFISLFPEPTPVPPNGLVDHVKSDFKSTLSKVKELHICSDPFLQEGLFNVWEIFQNSENSTFYTDGFPDIVTIDEYIKLQETLLHETTKEFKKLIRDTLEGVIVSVLTTQADTGLPTKKTKFAKMVLVSVRMLHTVLHKIVHETLIRFLDLFEKYLNKDNNLIPQFQIDLVFDNVLNSLPSFDEIQEKILNLLKTLETTVQSIPIINSSMINVDTSTVSFYDCIKDINSNKDKLSNYISVAYQPVSDFINQNKFLEEFLKLDPIEFVTNFDPK